MPSHVWSSWYEVGSSVKCVTPTLKHEVLINHELIVLNYEF